tara:strand:+ start:1116 stop:1862 length:747 start_codon:yes stop_codon:yes gene_type:complete
MAIKFEKNSLKYISKFAPIRCDTHFKHHIKLSDQFFNNKNIEWVSLDTILVDMKNGMNLSTKFYSMDKTSYYYLSVSQIKEYGLIEKNQNYITEDVTNEKDYFELSENMILVTRSGTVGISLSTNHNSFDFKENSYIPSGFVITAKVNSAYSADNISAYINLSYVQNFLKAMSAGKSQKNISQPVLKNLLIPSVLLNNKENKLNRYFNKYNEESSKILKKINDCEKQLEEIKTDLSEDVKKEIEKLYS